jgi:CRISPR-associated protein Cas1
MKRLLNTMYVTTQGGYLFRDGEAVVIKTDGTEKIRFPLLNLESLVCFGNVSISTPLLGFCAERSVGVSFLTENGRFLARSSGGVRGNVLLRRAQFRRADDLGESATIGRSMVVGKIINARVLLLRARREAYDGEVFDFSIASLGRILSEVNRTITLDELRGKEGEAAREYFRVFDHLIRHQKEDFKFHERSRRPPLDNVNALLSFVYTLLAHDVVSALESVGLDPFVGFLHRDRPGRPSLALDLMEELRPYLADRLVVSLINLRQVRGAGFNRTESGAVEMDDVTRKAVLVAYQKRKRDEIEHPFLKEKIHVGLVPYAQAQLLGRYLRGELDAYPPFISK